MMESGRGKRLLQQGRAGEAENVFRALLHRLEGTADYDMRYDLTFILLYIGLSLRAQGRPLQAVDFFRRAIVQTEGLEQTENVKNQIMASHADLASVLMAYGKYAEARIEYETALTFANEISDERNQGATLSRLGTLAMTQGDLNDARKRYHKALSLFQRMSEDQSEAVVWHQLGRVSEAAHDWDEAERCYKKSVNIDERIGDYQGVAQTCNQLAVIAESAGRPQEAERWYLRAIELKEKHSMPKDLPSSLNNLLISISPKAALTKPRNVPAARLPSRKHLTFRLSRGKPTTFLPKLPKSVDWWTKSASGGARSRSPLRHLRGVIRK